jgi:hypothetical protein
MRNLIVALAAAVLSGLAVYALLEWRGLLGLLGGTGIMTIPISAFIGAFAGVGVGSALLALLFREVLDRRLHQRIDGLSQRLAQIEQRGTGASERASA